MIKKKKEEDKRRRRRQRRGRRKKKNYLLPPASVARKGWVFSSTPDRKRKFSWFPGESRGLGAVITVLDVLTRPEKSGQGGNWSGVSPSATAFA